MESIKLLFTGDFCPHLRVEELVLKHSTSSVVNELAPDFHRADLTIVDLECPLTNSTSPIEKTGPNLKAHAKTIELLKTWNVTLAAMANNHIRDFGDAAMLDTKKLCEQNGIATVGVGLTLTEARKPFETNIKGASIAIINITENEWSNTYGGYPGANPLDLPKNFTDIKSAKKRNDFVIVVYHGGNEFFELPSPRLKETLRFFVEAGASAVVAHHTHIVSGYEVYNGSPIFYSLGNFLFDWHDKRNSFWNEGMAVQLFLRQDFSIHFELIPFHQNNENVGVYKLDQATASRFTERLDHLNEIIHDEARLAKAFEDFSAAKHDIYDLYLQPYRNTVLAALRKRGLLPDILGKRKKNLLLNITRCESHRDILMNFLKK